jgi:hypothetical protein
MWLAQALISSSPGRRIDSNSDIAVLHNEAAALGPSVMAGFPNNMASPAAILEYVIKQ